MTRMIKLSIRLIGIRWSETHFIAFCLWPVGTEWRRRGERGSATGEAHRLAVVGPGRPRRYAVGRESQHRPRWLQGSVSRQRGENQSRQRHATHIRGGQSITGQSCYNQPLCYGLHGEWMSLVSAKRLLFEVDKFKDWSLSFMIVPSFCTNMGTLKLWFTFQQFLTCAIASYRTEE